MPSKKEVGRMPPSKNTRQAPNYLTSKNTRQAPNHLTFKKSKAEPPDATQATDTEHKAKPYAY